MTRIIVIMILITSLVGGVLYDLPESIRADYLYWSQVLNG
jgi:hypothetical protein